MSHHLLPHMGREWLGSMTHAFLIRDPRPMLASLGEKLGEFDLLATGLPQQVEIFEHVVRSARARSRRCVDSADLLAAPEPMLRALCAALGVPFSPRMLSWPAGPRATDGVWAKHWYDRVEQSTGFERRQRGGRADGCSPAAWPRSKRECRPLYETTARAPPARLRRHPCCRNSTNAIAT